MPFRQDSLTEGEEVVLDLRPHWWYLAPSGAFLAAAVILGLAALWNDWADWGKIPIGVWVLGSLVWFGVRYLLWSTTNFVVTNERVISRSGFIAKQGIEIPLDRINTVFFNQSVFERILGAGDLGVESAGEGGRQTFTDIRKPSLVQTEIYRQVEALETRKAQRGGQVAAGGAAPDSIPQQIEKLDHLRRQGLITDAEFESKKRVLLDRM